MSQLGDFWRAFEPAPDIGLAEYSIRKVINEEGRPFDFLAFPHMVAPGGPMDAFDCATTREIVMQWASRLGKTFLVLCGSLYMAELAPCNQILAGHVQDLAMQQAERIRLMGEHNPAFAGTGLQTTQKKRLKIGASTIYAAWARSPGTLSNINALYGGASELDLWEHLTTSKHPDPEQMFGDRFKDNDVLRKEIYESIPTLAGTYIDDADVERPRSRIEARRKTGTDCRFWVGCPLCGARQVLVVDRVTEDGYRCDGCEDLISDEYRKAFIRSGVWAPAGCTVDPDKATAAANRRLDGLEEAPDLDEGDERLEKVRAGLRWEGWEKCDYLIGTPTNAGEVESYQLSSLYALSLSWRRIMQEDHTSQNFINQWLGETVEVSDDDVIDVEAEGAELAAAIIGELKQNKLPDWTRFIVITCDRQIRTFPWQVTAWDETIERVHVIDYGTALSFSEIEALLGRKWGTRSATIALIDSGYLSHDTYKWCVEMTKKKRMKVWPVKGDKAAAVKHHYKLFPVEDEKGRKQPYRKIQRVHINSQSTQEWCNVLLRERQSIRVWKAEPAEHQALCEQLVNEHEVIKRTAKSWERIDTTKPNDQRDDLRYGFCGAQLALKLGLGKTSTMKAIKSIQKTPPAQEKRPVGPSSRPVLQLQ